MLRSLVSLWQGNVEKFEKLMKIININREILNGLRKFNEIFRKDLTYDNTKSHKKPGLHPLFRRYIFGKSTECWGSIDLPLLSLLRVKLRPVSSNDMFNGKIYIYETCHMQVSKNAIPYQAVCNQMEIDLIPNEIRNLKCKEKKSKQNFV